MGKFNKSAKNRSVGLEIVPKDAEPEVALPESRKSDDAPLKKVKHRNFLQPRFSQQFFLRFIGKMGEPPAGSGVVWSWNQL